MSNSPVFIDTNILVYLRDKTDPAKHSTAQHWITALARNRQPRTSTQVSNEYLVTVTRKLSHPLSSEEAWEDVKSFSVWNPVAISTETQKVAKDTESDYRFSWWDSLIVAAAKQSHCHYLLTEDLAHGQNLDGLKVINPMLAQLEDLK